MRRSEEVGLLFLPRSIPHDPAEEGPDQRTGPSQSLWSVNAARSVNAPPYWFRSSDTF